MSEDIKGKEYEVTVTCSNCGMKTVWFSKEYDKIYHADFKNPKNWNCKTCGDKANISLEIKEVVK